MNEGYKRKKNSSFKAIYCAAELGIKTTCIGHSTLFQLCKLCGDQVPLFYVVKYWLQLFSALLNDMLIFQAGVIQPVHAQLCCTALSCTCLQENDWVTCSGSKKVVPSSFPQFGCCSSQGGVPGCSTLPHKTELLWAHCVFHGLTAALNRIVGLYSLELSEL